MESSQKLLDAAYRHLGYAEGDLFDAVDSPSGFAPEVWLNKGEWLALAKSVNAEKVFFVDNNPVIVFATADSNNQKERFRQIWNMARPPLLFLASPGELAVYNLNHGPARNQNDWEKTLEKRQLETAKTTTEVSEKLQEFRREQIETGLLFEDRRFGDNERADKALIANLQVIRNKLLKMGLETEYAHSLIGRSIFLRYLEDRKILKEEYFKKVAEGKSKWLKILNEPVSGSFVDPELADKLYLRVLRNKDFTYALFKQLSKDFNGDMFPDIEAEQGKIDQSHLDLLGKFLCGNADEQQLFFFAYKFDVIPIELISSIYEEFYNTGKNNTGNNGSHYTPPALVEFLLSQVLSSECLDKKPRIIDPACGSGIFLVESFRRIVRHKVRAQNGKRLSDIQLRKILREQIAGIDINEEAVRVAAFSLYLAFLHYQKPPDILEQIKQGKKLPNLKYEKNRKARNPEQHYDILLVANSFEVKSKIVHDDVLSRFNDSCANVVVGNPPWGSPGKKKEEIESRDAMDVAIQWCEKQEPALPIGDREWSQAFIYRVIDLLCDNGRAALLVSSGVLFKIQENSRDFRKKWLATTTLQSIVNLVHTRDVFFKGETRQSGAQSPFVAVYFTKQKPDYDSIFEYWSAKKTAMIQEMQAVVLNAADLKRLRQNDVIKKEILWKTHWWGNHRDEALVHKLSMESTLEGLVIRNKTLASDDIGRGFEKRSGSRLRNKCLNYKMLPASCFKRYGPIDDDALLETPSSLYLTGNTNLYEGLRLLIKRGITQKGFEKGRILARLETKSFCFSNSIYGIKMPKSAIWEGHILVGIIWSSLARYYYWLTTGSWGMWHHEILQECIQKLPVKLPDNLDLRNRIVKIVEQLQSKGANTTTPELRDKKNKALTFDETIKLEKELDEAIFDLYELDEAERDLIKDMCDYGLDLFYNNFDSQAVKPVEADRPVDNYGVFEDVPTRRDRQKGFEGYIRTFLRIWNRELDPDGEFRWQLIRPGKNIPMVAIVFSTQDKKNPLSPVKNDNMTQWNNVLAKLDETLLTKISKRVYIDGVVRAVSDTDIMIVKRNEKRLWTRSMAREDAEATLLQAIHLQESNRGQL